MKGRHFEIPACGSMQLSYFIEDLASLFKFGEEIEIFNSPEEFVEKAQYYLKNAVEREKIAEAGYQRAIKDCTYSKNFFDVFKRQGWI